MTFFVDTNVLIYSAVKSEYQAGCQQVLEAVAGGAAGRTSTAVLEEVWHIELSGKAGDIRGLTKQCHTIFTPLLIVSDAAFAAALSLDAPKLGSDDRVHVGTCSTNEISVILSADKGFDYAPGVRRVDPLDERAVHELLNVQ